MSAGALCWPMSRQESRMLIRNRRLAQVPGIHRLGRDDTKERTEQTATQTNQKEKKNKQTHFFRYGSSLLGTDTPSFRRICFVWYSRQDLFSYVRAILGRGRQTRASIGSYSVRRFFNQRFSISAALHDASLEEAFSQ